MVSSFPPSCFFLFILSYSSKFSFSIIWESQPFWVCSSLPSPLVSREQQNTSVLPWEGEKCRQDPKPCNPATGSVGELQRKHGAGECFPSISEQEVIPVASLCKSSEWISISDGLWAVSHILLPGEGGDTALLLRETGDLTLPCLLGSEPQLLPLTAVYKLCPASCADLNTEKCLVYKHIKGKLFLPVPCISPSLPSLVSLNIFPLPELWKLVFCIIYFSYLLEFTGLWGDSIFTV